MNYEFDLDEWLPRFPLEARYGAYSGEDITSPCDLCNNEWLRREMKEHFIWGEPVPVDVFVHSLGEPENRYATKIGGLPYRPADAPWPVTAGGRSMALLAQFNFTNSRDIVGDLPGDLLLIFGDDSDGPIVPRQLEWQNIGLTNLASELPPDCMPITPCFGNRCRTVSYPDAEYPTRRGRKWEGPRYNDKKVTRFYLLFQYQATQIGRAPFFIQPGDHKHPGSPLCTIASVQPEPHMPYPWINHPQQLCANDQWPGRDDHLMIDDLGCIYVFIEDDGTLHAGQSSY